MDDGPGTAAPETGKVVPAPCDGDGPGEGAARFAHVAEGVADIPGAAARFKALDAPNFLYLADFHVGSDNAAQSGDAVARGEVLDVGGVVGRDHVDGMAAGQLGEHLGHAGEGLNPRAGGLDAGPELFGEGAEAVDGESGADELEDGVAVEEAQEGLG